MKSFKKKNPRGNKFAGGKRFGSKPSGGRGFGGRNDHGSDRKPWENGPEMHETSCDGCGGRARVPFRPNGSKPVLCSDCFRTDDDVPQGKFDRDRAKKRGFDRPKFGEKRTFERGPKGHGPDERRMDEVNAKLDLIIRELAALKEVQR
ncbi:CxxC-x17-CxxC domain-containing protein [Patescibacteria group bacterium]